jgi:hypothetical protein
MTGHVWLSPEHTGELAREMDEQGMSRAIALTELGPGAKVPPGAVDAVLRRASPEPRVITDAKLWSDWLAFLDGAAENGGLVVQ